MGLNIFCSSHEISNADPHCRLHGFLFEGEDRFDLWFQFRIFLNELDELVACVNE